MEAFAQGVKVLLVDDDTTCLKVVGKMLQCCKYNGNRSIYLAVTNALNYFVIYVCVCV